MYLVDDWSEVNELTATQISDVYENNAKSLNESNLFILNIGESLSAKNR